MNKTNYTELSEGIQEIANVRLIMNKLVEYFKKNKKSKSRSLFEDIAESQQKMMSFSNLLTDQPNVFKELINPDLRKDKIKKIEDSYAKHSKAEMLNDLVRAKLLIEVLKLKIQLQDENIKLLKEFYQDYQKNRLEKNKAKQSGKKKVYKHNNDCLQQCYIAFVKTLTKPVSGQDYSSYWRYLLKLYPKPPFIPQPRLTQEEKQQSKKIQSEDRDLKARNSWSDATVREAFEKFSGVKPTTLKK